MLTSKLFTTLLPVMTLALALAGFTGVKAHNACCHKDTYWYKFDDIEDSANCPDGWDPAEDSECDWSNPNYFGYTCDPTSDPSCAPYGAPGWQPPPPCDTCGDELLVKKAVFVKKAADGSPAKNFDTEAHRRRARRAGMRATKKATH